MCMKPLVVATLVLLALVAVAPAGSAQPMPESCAMESGPDGSRALHCTGLVPLCIFLVRGPQAIECTP
jgi:hypothetical protein